jgi:hypothetical protein
MLVLEIGGENEKINLAFHYTALEYSSEFVSLRFQSVIILSDLRAGEPSQHLHYRS